MAMDDEAKERVAQDIWDEFMGAREHVTKFQATVANMDRDKLFAAIDQLSDDKLILDALSASQELRRNMSKLELWNVMVKVVLQREPVE